MLGVLMPGALADTTLRLSFTLTDFFSQNIIDLEPMKNKDRMEEILPKLIGSTSRPRILNFLLSHSKQTFYQREIMYETGLSLQATQRELENLIHLGILIRRETKSRVYYQVNSTSPWFRPLREICEVIGRG